MKKEKKLKIITLSLELLKDVVLQAPVHIGDVVIADVCGCGVDIIATKEITKA